MDAKKKVASGYGEADIEAKAMSEAASDPGGKPAEVPSPPPAEALVPAQGTTETDIAANIQEKASRSNKR
jgi:hypothetical protein